MAIFTVFVMIGITMALVWGSIYLVTGQASDDWTGLMAVSIGMVLIKTSRNWVMFIDESASTMLILRFAVTLICMVVLYLYAHIRLGRESQREKIMIAVLYPGVTLVIALITLALHK
jgi:hypothetical protein